LKRFGLLALLLAISMSLSMTQNTSSVSACAFSVVPNAYEGPKDRSLYLEAMDLAAYNMIAPGDSYFGLPRLEEGPRGDRSSVEPVIPPILLKSISWIESSISQTTRSNAATGINPTLISFDCGHGIMQVTSGMTVPLGDGNAISPQQVLVATHYAYNIARGAAILADKWNTAPEGRPVAGTDTDADPDIVENWYFAVWSYNGFSGPGASRSNHPMDPIYGNWPRTDYSCGPSSDGYGHNRGNYPYQELVWGCANHPPEVDGDQLWEPFELTLPDLSKTKWSGPLAISNWVAPYSNMDIPTPHPYHEDDTPQPPASEAYEVLGLPQLSVGETNVSFALDDAGNAAPVTIKIGNTGTGVLAWGATTSSSWLRLSPPAGVALANDVDCGGDCTRDAELTLTLNPSALSSGSRRASVRVYSPQTNESQTIVVTIAAIGKTGVPGVVRH
jgi:hypothetical protein